MTPQTPVSIAAVIGECEKVGVRFWLKDQGRIVIVAEYPNSLAAMRVEAKIDFLAERREDLVRFLLARDGPPSPSDNFHRVKCDRCAPTPEVENPATDDFAGELKLTEGQLQSSLLR